MSNFVSKLISGSNHENLYVESKLEIQWEPLDQFRKYTNKKKTKTLGAWTTIFQERKNKPLTPWKCKYVPVTSQRGIIQQNMLHNSKKWENHILFLKAVSLDTRK